MSKPTMEVEAESSSPASEGSAACRPLSVCLFCGSSAGADVAYLEAARGFGGRLASEGVRLVYGGGGIGLMGAAAKAAHDAGGEVLGVMPAFLRRRELIYDEVETIVVDNMHERKRVMFQQADAFVVFPGGIGTLEEAIELMSWRRLDLHHKPMVFLNLDRFWTPLFELIAHTIERQMSPAWLPSTWIAVDHVTDVLPAIRAALAATTYQAPPPNEIASKV